MKLLFLLFGLISCSLVLKSETVISGKILGYNKELIPFSDLCILKFDKDTIIEHHSSNKGLINFKTKLIGYYRIRFTGTNHREFEIPFFFRDAKDTFNFDVQLEPFYFPTPPDKIPIIGNFNDFDWDKPIYLQKGLNNIYSGLVKKKNPKNDTIIYQVITNDTLNGEPVWRSINGTQGKFHKLDYSFKDYSSFIIERGGEVKIQFDLNQFPTRKVAPNIKVLNKNAKNFELIYGYLKILENRNRFEKKQNEIAKRYKSKGITNFLSNTLDKLTSKSIKEVIYFEMDDTYKSFKNSKDYYTREMFALEYIRYVGSLLLLKYSPYIGWLKSIEIQQNNLNQVLKNINLRSPLLSSDNFFRETPKLYALVLCHLNQPKYFGFLDSLVDHYPSEKVSIDVLDACIEFYTAVNKNEERANYYYQKLLANFPNSETALYYRGKMGRKIKTGSTCPSFVTNSLSDTTRKLSFSNFKGKYLLIDFWSTTCGPCIAEFPILLEAYKKYKTKNFEILSVSLDVDYNKALNYVKKNNDKLPWSHAVETKSFQSKIAKDFGVLAIPFPILVDPSGKVIATDIEVRGKYLLNKLKEIFKY